MDTAPRPFRNDIRFQLAALTFDRHVLLIILIVSEDYKFVDKFVIDKFVIDKFVIDKFV